MSAYLRDEVNLTSFFLERCGVVLEGGEMLIDNGSGAVSLYFGCPQNQLIAGVGKIIEAVNDRG